MKSIKKQFFALLFVILFLNQDLVIEVKAKSANFSGLKLLTKKNENSAESGLQVQKNLLKKNPPQKVSQNSTQLDHRLKDKTVTKFDPFGITLFVLLAVLIVFTIYKYCLNKKLQKAIEWLHNEKNKARVEKYHLRIKESTTITDFCLSFQKISHLFKSYEVMSKVYEQDLNDALKDATKMTTKEIKPKKFLPRSLTKRLTRLSTDITGKRDKLTKIEISNMMVENCYNTFKSREGYTETTIPNKEKEGEEYEAIESMEDVVKKASVSIKAVIHEYKDNAKEAALWAIDPDTAELPGTITDVLTDPTKAGSPYEVWSAKDPGWSAIQPTEWVLGGATFVDTLSKLKDAADLIDTWKDDQASWAKKIIATLQWLFDTANSILSSVGEVQKISGADNILDFPFLSLGSSITSLADKIRLWIDTKKELAKEKENPAKQLEEVLAFWDMMDDGIDLLQDIASTILYILAPFTAGISQIVNTAMKLVVCWIHIGMAHWKLHIFSKMKHQIVVFYEKQRKEQKDKSDAFIGKLVSEKCGQIHILIKAFIEKELDEIENNLEDTQGWMTTLATKSTMSDDEVKQNVEKIVSVVCKSDPENCLEFVNRLKLDMTTLESLNKHTAGRVRAASKWTKFGPINSAYLVSKILVEDIFKNDDFKDYVANTQNKLLINGYFPTYQTYKYDLFTCRLCVNPYYQLDNVEFGVKFEDLNGKIKSAKGYISGDITGKFAIQESVETYSNKDKEGEIARYFVAHFAEIEPDKWTDFNTATILPVPNTGDVTDHKFKMQTGDYEDTKNHEILTFCTTKSKRADLLIKAYNDNIQKGQLNRQNAKKKKTKGWEDMGTLTILQTIYTQQTWKKGEANHDFATVMISHMKGKFDLSTLTTEKEKELIHCQSFEDLWDIRYHHFMMHLKKDPAVLADGEENSGNVPEESLIATGWKKFKSSELIYKELGTFSDYTYKWELTLYSKEFIGEMLPQKKLEANFLKETLKTIFELKNELKSQFIKSISDLYCVNECKSLDDKRPLKFTRGL